MPSFRAWVSGNPFTTTLASGTSVLTGRLPKPWFKVVSAYISSTSGMTLPQTKHIQFLKPIEKLTQPPTPDPDACGPAGLISSPSNKPQEISLGSLKLN